MRTIKFKAWHADQKKMYPAEELGTDQMTLSADGRGFVNVNSKHVDLSEFAGEVMIPLQFTGLLDKNGKEIYEGDIVKYGTVGVGDVRWREDDYAGFCIKVSGFFYYVGGWKESTAIIPEIIGNIYENPELLK